jgi:hypothetical protein
VALTGALKEGVGMKISSSRNRTRCIRYNIEISYPAIFRCGYSQYIRKCYSSLPQTATTNLRSRAVLASVDTEKVISAARLLFPLLSILRRRLLSPPCLPSRRLDAHPLTPSSFESQHYTLKASAKTPPSSASLPHAHPQTQSSGTPSLRYTSTPSPPHSSQHTPWAHN